MNVKALFPALLSFIIAGLGQLILGKWVKALLFLLFEMCTAGVAVYIHYGAGVFLNFAVSFFSAIDAYHTAAKKYAVEKPAPPPAIREDLKRLKVF